jgi:two-component system, LytTR family, response regulator
MIQAVYTQTTTPPGIAASLLLGTSKGTVAINVNHIVRIAASSSYSKLFFVDGKTMVVSKVLKWFEQHLVAGSFLRIHRGHLVNRGFIQQWAVNGQRLMLTNGEWVAVSRRRRGGRTF